GLADYFEQKRADGGTTFGRALAQDAGWDLDEVLRVTKTQLTPKFAPRTRGKAFYSDTNYQLLGAIIEAVTGMTYARVVDQRIAAPHGLEATYVFDHTTSGSYDKVAPMLHGRTPLRIPRTMASVQADGGVVSTADESLRLVQAFFGGRLFDPAHLPE